MNNVTGKISKLACKCRPLREGTRHQHFSKLQGLREVASRKLSTCPSSLVGKARARSWCTRRGSLILSSRWAKVTSLMGYLPDTTTPYRAMKRSKFKWALPVKQWSASIALLRILSCRGKSQSGNKPRLGTRIKSKYRTTP